MKSGLRDRNNAKQFVAGWGDPTVSMKSGLRDRNNAEFACRGSTQRNCLNEVRS